MDGQNLIGGPVSDYISREASRRSSKLYIIPTTREQDDAAFRRAVDIDYFRPPLDYTNIIGDNCSLRSNQILDAAGIPNNNWFFPDTYPGTAGSRAEVQAPHLSWYLVEPRSYFCLTTPSFIFLNLPGDL